MSTAHESVDVAAMAYDRFLGEVRAEFARRRLRQTTVARQIGMPQQHLSARLSGHTPFRFVELIRLAEALDMPLTTLASLAEMPVSESPGDDVSGWFGRQRAVAYRLRSRMTRHARAARIAEQQAQAAIDRAPNVHRIHAPAA